MLPPEILSIVCSYAPKPTLKNLRLVWNVYDQAASVFLFDQIFLSFNATDLRIAKLLVIRFGQYIQTLVFSSNTYLDLDEEDFIEAYEEYDGMGDEPDFNTSDARSGFQVLCKTRKMQKQILQSGSCPAHLSFVLANSPKLRKIILTDEMSSRSMSLSSLKDHLPWSMEMRLNADCDLYFEHLRCSQRSGFVTGGITNPWRTALLGLIAINSAIKELTMEPQDPKLTSDSAAFRLSPMELRDAKVCFGALTKLHLSLTTGTTNSTGGIHQNVAKLLGAARCLQCLSIYAFGEENCSIQAVLGECDFPKLTSLILAFLDSSEADLMRVLRGSRRLEQLYVHGHTLTSGSWARLVGWAKASLPLKNVSFNQLYGGFEEPWVVTEYLNVYNDVDQYFLRKRR